jgi:hypothetical protein
MRIAAQRPGEEFDIDKILAQALKGNSRGEVVSILDFKPGGGPNS